MFYWLKEFFWYQSDTVAKERLNSALQQKRNKKQKFSWSMVISDEDDKDFWTSKCNTLSITIDKKKKQIKLVNYFPREFAWRNSNKITETMVLSFHSEIIYLPEFPLPKTQENEYALIRQNLQQTIELETGVKFIDTQQFLLEYGSELGMFASPDENFFPEKIVLILFPFVLLIICLIFF